ncbi:Endonuclease/exonuclease/phosphatase family protein [Ceratobasidium theobromae]|uniref:Endonuclease/exonuclease/phosphatase family protein n=1 Tax=Ceratobasidium theobromae TaxID=1582974 RepID=A0A5N5QNF0_9AGAM|nr:Endonuclease/exonuclease/phosphatase family protein [Ceratobasidium theobromae]
MGTLCFATPSIPSDHSARSNLAMFKPQKSKALGGPHGKSFDDSSAIPFNARVSSITLRGANRLDGISYTVAPSARVINHGGLGGTAKTLNLGYLEWITSVKICWGKFNQRTRIFYALFTTNEHRTIEAGKKTDQCETITAPKDWAVTGMFGRDGNEIDQIGFIHVYTPTWTRGRKQYQ